MPPIGQIDSHQHFWRLERGDYGWLTPALKPLHRDFGPADLAPFLQRHGIAGTVLVQAAATVAEVYKQRWAIELFFKALKQSLRIKTFVGTSANALKTQIWVARIAMLLIKYLQLKATFGWWLSNLVALLRQQLFVYRDLWVWIDHPFQAPEPPESLPAQLAMVWQ